MIKRFLEGLEKSVNKVYTRYPFWTGYAAGVVTIMIIAGLTD
jgi:hypothetical protein